MNFGSDTPTPELGSTETLVVDSRTVACDGGTGALGHPRVWLHIEGKQTFCPWCSRIFVLDEEAAAADTGH